MTLGLEAHAVDGAVHLADPQDLLDVISRPGGGGSKFTRAWNL
jgi:hypothetical protein